MIKNLILENFKIFKEKANLPLSGINIFTGPNNSGKSTVIKAIKLFSSGIDRTIFPNINLIDEKDNLGHYEDIKTWDTTKNIFKIGFPITLSPCSEEFTLIYSFKNGQEYHEEFTEYTSFAGLEIFDSKGQLFFCLETNGFEDEVSPVLPEFASENTDIGVLTFRFDVESLHRITSNMTTVNFRKLFEQLDKIKTSEGYWWGEIFSENEMTHVDYNISLFDSNDVVNEFRRDSYHNICDYNLQLALLYNPDDQIIENYSKIIEVTKYNDFITLVIERIFTSIRDEINTLKYINHIKVEPETPILIPINYSTSYLKEAKRLLASSEFLVTLNDLLKIFSLNCLLEIKDHLASAFEINIIYDIQMKPEKYFVSLDDFKQNRRVNISNLGKGTSNLIKLMLNVLVELSKYQEEKTKKEEYYISIGKKPESTNYRIIMVEEPEAFLHPNWQSLLADFFYMCYEKFDVQFMIETHSVYLIQKFQFLVAKKEIQPELLNFLYFASDNPEIKFYKLRLREDGIFKEGFGPGFYDETARLTLDILNANSLN